MVIKTPYEIGDKVVVDGKNETVKGIHVYVKEDGTIAKWRLHLGDGRFVSLPNTEAE